jgi:hypothetical protein
MARAILGPEPSASLSEERETSTEVEQVEWKWKGSRGMKEIDPTVGGCSQQQRRCWTNAGDLGQRWSCDADGRGYQYLDRSQQWL